MFDLSFIELVIIAVVALIVLGPEKLPKAARTVGGLLRKAKQSWNAVRDDIDRELAAEELKRNVGDIKSQVDQAIGEVNDTLQQASQIDADPCPEDSDQTPNNNEKS